MAKMRKIIIGLFIVLFCFSVGTAQEELSAAVKKEIDEFLRKVAWLNFSYWVEDENSRKLKRENDRLEKLLENFRAERFLLKEDVVRHRWLLELTRPGPTTFMLYPWSGSWLYPSPRKYFTTPNWSLYFWLDYYRKR